MANEQARADFVIGVVRTAMLEGFTKEQFMNYAETAWLVLTENRERREKETEGSHE